MLNGRVGTGRQTERHLVVVTHSRFRRRSGPIAQPIDRLTKADFPDSHHKRDRVAAGATTHASPARIAKSDPEAGTKTIVKRAMPP
jgi:hypothetical protein